jgi:YHS domain-containing protein
MVKAYITSAVAGAFLLGLATVALAVTGEFSNMCTMGLASEKDIQTDCSINSQLEGKTYCFGSKEAMAEFMKNPKENLAKAQAYYSKKQPRRT